MPDRTPAETDALHTVAALILAYAAKNVDWSEYPDIGEDDWFEICEILEAKAPDVSVSAYDAAYGLLSARAEASDV